MNIEFFRLMMEESHPPPKELVWNGCSYTSQIFDEYESASYFSGAVEGFRSGYLKAINLALLACVSADTCGDASSRETMQRARCEILKLIPKD